MLPKTNGRKRLRLRWLYVMGVFISSVVLLGLPTPKAWAQTPTETPTLTPTPAPLSVTSVEPRQVNNAATATLSVTGANFTQNTVVRLIGYGYLTTTVINANALTASIPAGVNVGSYVVEVSDPDRGTLNTTAAVSVFAIPPTVQPIPTNPPPTPIPGQPSLLVSTFVANPSTVSLGGSVSLTFTVVNQGNLPAFGVSVAVDSGSKFLPSNGQASVTLPDLFPNSTYSASLNVSVATDAPNGANVVPLTFSYRDSDGKTYTSKASLSVTVDAQTEPPQLTLLTYTVTPELIIPSNLAVISAEIKNSGTQTASQVLVRMTGDTRVLIAGPRGDAFPVGDIPPNETRKVELPLIVAQDAKFGVQPQAFVISYIQDGKAIELTSTFTVQVAQVQKTRPLILLKSSSSDVERLKPGDRFTLTFTLENVGTEDANSMLVTFGTVQSSGGDNGGGTPQPNNTTTTTSTTFAPLDSGGTQFVGTVAQDGEVTLEQTFIVSATLDSGIYGLPISAQYTRRDGTTATDSFNATVVVVAPPKLQVSFETPLPPFSTVGDVIPIAVKFTNRGKNPLIINTITVTTEGADVYDGAETAVGQLKTDETADVSTTISPTVEGAFRVIFNVNYIDDLNQPQTVQYAYDLEAAPLPPPPDIVEPEFPLETPTPEPTPDSEDIVTQLLLGFLGLGE